MASSSTSGRGARAPSSPDISMAPAPPSSGSSSAIDQILAGSGRKAGLYSQRRRTSFGSSGNGGPGGAAGAGTSTTKPRQQKRGQVRGRGAGGRLAQSSSSSGTAAAGTAAKNTPRGAKSPTPPAMASVNTGSRRARALRQLAAKRSRKSGSNNNSSSNNNNNNNNNNSNIGAAVTAATDMKVTPKPTSQHSGGGKGRRVSLGTTPVSGANAGIGIGIGNTPTPRAGNADWRSRSGGMGGAAVTPAAADHATTTTATGSAAKSRRGGTRYGSACVRFPLPPSASSLLSSSSAADPAAADPIGAGILNLRITSRTDRAGGAVPASTSTGTGTIASAETPTPSSTLPLELRPVRLVPLHANGNGAMDPNNCTLPFLCHGNDDYDGDDDGGNTIGLSSLHHQNVESICDNVWERGDRCTVVEEEDIGVAGEAEADGSSPSSSTIRRRDHRAVPLSLTTVNVLLGGVDAAVLLRRCDMDDIIGAGTDDDMLRRYCLYRPTSVSGGDLFVLPEAVADDAMVDVAGSEKILAWDGSAAAIANEDGGDQPIESSDQVEGGDDMVVPASAEESNKLQNDTSRPPASPSPPAPLQPVALSELTEAYENCIGESGEPSPSDIATDLLPRYLASEDVVAAMATSSLASIYDMIRSEGLLPSKDKVVFEVRDGLAATDRREGLVRLVSAQVMIRLGLLVHGQDDYLGWYFDSFGREADGDVLAAKESKKKKKRKKSKKSSSSSPADFFRREITELLSCVQFALPTTQTFAEFLKEVVASPFGETLNETVSALFDYFEVEVPDAETRGENHDDVDRPISGVAGDMIDPGCAVSLQSEAKSGVAFPLLEESLKSEIDDKSNKDETTEEVPDPDSPLFRRGSVDLARKSSNPLLANGKHTYIGSHFSNKLTNMSDLFREVEVPMASSRSMSNSKKERLGETRAADPVSSSLKKRPRTSSTLNSADGDTPAPPKTDLQQSKTVASRPFAPAAKVGSESSSGANQRHVNDRHIVKETPMKPSRRSRIFGTSSIVPETPARQPQRNSTHHLVAEVAALAAARNKKPRHR